MSTVINSVAPDFSLDTFEPDGTFGKLSLSEQAGKWVVLCSYPLNFSFGCPGEVLAINDLAPAFKALNATLAIGSVDSIFAHEAWTMIPKRQRGLGGRLAIPMFADLGGAWGKAYGVLGANNMHTRATIIINPDGKIVYKSEYPSGVGRNSDEILRVLEALITVREKGEACPVNFKKGGLTIKPTLEGSLEYFAAVNKE